MEETAGKEFRAREAPTFNEAHRPAPNTTTERRRRLHSRIPKQQRETSEWETERAASRKNRRLQRLHFHSSATGLLLVFTQNGVALSFRSLTNLLEKHTCMAKFRQRRHLACTRPSMLKSRLLAPCGVCIQTYEQYTDRVNAKLA